MSEISEVDAGMELAFEAAKKLFQVCPNHELLDLFKKADDDETWNGFQTRFGKEGLTPEQRSCEPAQAYFWTNYFLALKEVCEENNIEV
jgi:hypothetical protein